MSTALAFDPGYGNVKVFTEAGGVVMQSAVSIAGERLITRMTGVRIRRPPLRVSTSAGEFYVGEGAHDWGRPVENLDFDRLNGSPEMMALWYGALTQYGLPHEPISLLVGLPIHVLSGPNAQGAQQAVRESLRGSHTWVADGQEQGLQVETVRLTSQPVGAMFDYLLDDEARMPTSRQVAFRGEVGILGIGMNTLDLLVVRGGTPVQRFTAGETLGVRRLLEVTDHDEAFSLSERDAQLRSGRLPAAAAVAVWQSEVLGFLERKWGDSFQRFEVVIASGGGSLLLREALLRRFRERLHIPDDPVIATARGLFKYARMATERAGHG